MYPREINRNLVNRRIGFYTVIRISEAADKDPKHIPPYNDLIKVGCYISLHKFMS